MAQSRAMERPFDPVTLRMFVAVCEERNIARAAEREAIVASAISKRIAAIESELGVQLLESLSVGKSYVRRRPPSRRVAARKPACVVARLGRRPSYCPAPRA